MRAICFDLDETLLHLERDIGDVIASAFEAVAGESREDWLAAYDEGGPLGDVPGRLGWA